MAMSDFVVKVSTHCDNFASNYIELTVIKWDVNVEPLFKLICTFKLRITRVFQAYLHSITCTPA